MVRIEVLSFDMEGTLIDHSFSNLIWEHDIPRIYGIQNDLDFEAAKNYVMEQYTTVGDGNPEWYDTDYWFQRLGIDRDWRRLLTDRRDDCNPYPDTLEALECLRGSRSLIVSSNTIREFLEIQLKKLPEVFGHVFSAPSDFGTVKNSGFFRRVCDTMEMEPEAVMHIGDSPRFDYEAARDAGINSFLLDRSGEAQGEDVIRSLSEVEEVLRVVEGGRRNSV